VEGLFCGSELKESDGGRRKKEN